MNFSVLLSVYYKENPLFLQQALDSVFNQTVLPNEIILIDPDNVAELALAMKNLLSDTKLANQYAQKAVDRARLFTWEKTAELTLSVYNLF